MKLVASPLCVSCRQVARRACCVAIAFIGMTALSAPIPQKLTAVARVVLDRAGKPVQFHPYKDVNWLLVEVEVTNPSPKTITLGNSPTRIRDEWKTKTGDADDGEGVPSRATHGPYRFVQVKPQGSQKFRIYLPPGLMAPGSKSSLTLLYEGNIGPKDPGAWLGEIKTKIVPSSK